MLSDYIKAALRHAHYELLSDDQSFYGEIDGFEGVCANAKTLEECREQLAAVLEEWVFLRIHKNLPLPTVDGVTLKISAVA
jgi:predicted RNase H-like HicB family nuclease